ncbi:MAG: DUF1492 domain-containing protein [Clostridia bacterium]|nr:DUF1492 domain-containing protein [Clostridia bacterium]
MTNKDAAQTLELYRRKAQELDALIRQREAVDSDAEIVQRISELAEMRLEIGRRIDEIGDDDLRRVLYLRYVHGLIWRDIAAEMGIRRETAHRLHRHALKALSVEGARKDGEELRQTQGTLYLTASEARANSEKTAERAVLLPARPDAERRL